MSNTYFLDTPRVYITNMDILNNIHDLRVN